jgi:hypothetical protein
VGAEFMHAGRTVGVLHGHCHFYTSLLAPIDEKIRHPDYNHGILFTDFPKPFGPVL